MESLWAGFGPLIASAAGGHWFDAGGPFMTWAFWFLVTLLIEISMVTVAWRFRGTQGKLRSWMLACLIGNLVSHPTATWLGDLVGLPGQSLSAFAIYTLLETAVIVVEAWAFRIWATNSWTEATVMSFVANGVTAVLGAYYMFLT